jgi:hypothetical protein
MLIGKFGELIAAAPAEKGKGFRHDEVAITDESKLQEKSKEEILCGKGEVRLRRAGFNQP